MRQKRAGESEGSIHTMEDRLYKYLRYYNASPQWLRQLAGCLYKRIPPSIRYGRACMECANLLRQSQWWPKEKLAEYQWRQLETLLEHAYKNVPYYRRIFDERRLRPRDIQDFDDYRKIPFLTKQIIRDNFQELIAQDYPQSSGLRVETGGSTGEPLVLLYEKGVSRLKDGAFVTAVWRRVGYESGDRLAVLEHHAVASASKGTLWTYEPIKNRLVLSIYHMTDNTMPKYLDKMKQFRPKFIHAFPSALMVMARFMKLTHIAHIPSVQAILCGSENLYPEQRDLFEDVFKCRVLNWYGQSELVTLAGGCERSNNYHIFPEYGITEVIGNDERVVTEEGQVGEIVGTGFCNRLMPLIRYRTADLAVHTNSGCECGRSYPMLKSIEGRSHEFFVASDDSLIPLLGNYDIRTRMLRKIKELQFVQEVKGQVTVNVVKEAGCDGNQIQSELRGKLRERSGKRQDSILDFEIKFVPEIQRTQRAKQKLLIQKVPIRHGSYESYP